MLTFELVDKLKQVMMDTGRGSRPVVFLDDDSGDVYNVSDVVFDVENNSFFIKGTLIDP